MALFGADGDAGSVRLPAGLFVAGWPDAICPYTGQPHPTVRMQVDAVAGGLFDRDTRRLHGFVWFTRQGARRYMRSRWLLGLLYIGPLLFVGLQAAINAANWPAWTGLLLLPLLAGPVLWIFDQVAPRRLDVRWNPEMGWVTVDNAHPDYVAWVKASGAEPPLPPPVLPPGWVAPDLGVPGVPSAPPRMSNGRRPIG